MTKKCVGFSSSRVSRNVYFSNSSQPACAVRGVNVEFSSKAQLVVRARLTVTRGMKCSAACATACSDEISETVNLLHATVILWIVSGGNKSCGVASRGCTRFGLLAYKNGRSTRNLRTEIMFLRRGYTMNVAYRVRSQFQNLEKKNVCQSKCTNCV